MATAGLSLAPFNVAYLALSTSRLSEVVSLVTDFGSVEVASKLLLAIYEIYVCIVRRLQSGVLIPN